MGNAQASGEVPANVAEARAWIAKWKASSGQKADGFDLGKAILGGIKMPWAASPDAKPGNGVEASKAAADVPGNVQEAREWIRSWRAKCVPLRFVLAFLLTTFWTDSFLQCNMRSISSVRCQFFFLGMLDQFPFPFSSPLPIPFCFFSIRAVCLEIRLFANFTNMTKGRMRHVLQINVWRADRAGPTLGEAVYN